MSIDLQPFEADTFRDEAIARQQQLLLGSVASMMAHEFNNLMTPVLARSQDALNRNDLEAMRKALTVTLSQTQRAIDIARRLLDVARGESPEKRNWNLRPLVERAVEALVRPVDKDGIDLKIDVAPEISIYASRPLFEQMLFNLLLNARKAVGERGGRIAVKACNGGSMVTIDVTDNGPGFDSLQREEVVNPFLARSSHLRPLDWRELGIGLSVCRMITQMHGGRLAALENEPRGCMMRVEWPCAIGGDSQLAS